MAERVRRFLVVGRVQGVGFRAATRRQAEALGLRGYARNLPGGEVEVLACGGDAEIAHLRAWLEHGPVWARVDEVRELEAPADPDPVGFSTG